MELKAGDTAGMHPPCPLLFAGFIIIAFVCINRVKKRCCNKPGRHGGYNNEQQAGTGSKKAQGTSPCAEMQTLKIKNLVQLYNVFSGCKNFRRPGELFSKYSGW